MILRCVAAYGFFSGMKSCSGYRSRAARGEGISFTAAEAARDQTALPFLEMCRGVGYRAAKRWWKIDGGADDFATANPDAWRAKIKRLFIDLRDEPRRHGRRRRPGARSLPANRC